MDPRSMQMAEDGAAPLNLRQLPRKVTETTCRYAMERTNDFITVWFWGRNSVSVPGEVANGADWIDTDDWVRPFSLRWKTLPNIIIKGTPVAHFPNNNCDIASHFGPASIIINIALCKWV
jgi:hypothetical protein